MIQNNSISNPNLDLFSCFRLFSSVFAKNENKNKSKRSKIFKVFFNDSIYNLLNVSNFNPKRLYQNSQSFSFSKKKNLFHLKRKSSKKRSSENRNDLNPCYLPFSAAVTLSLRVVSRRGVSYLVTWHVDPGSAKA